MNVLGAFTGFQLEGKARLFHRQMREVVGTWCCANDGHDGLKKIKLFPSGNIFAEQSDRSRRVASLMDPF